MQIYIYGMDIFVQNWYDLLIIWPSNNNETTWSLIKYLDEKYKTNRLVTLKMKRRG